MTDGAEALLNQIAYRLIDRQLTVEPIPTPPVGFSPFRFHPPDETSTVGYPDTPPAIAHPSLLQLETTSGIFNR